MSARELTETVARLRASLGTSLPSIYPDGSMDRRYRTDLERVLDVVSPRQCPLTTRQAEILAFVRECITATGAAPTYRQIADRFGYRSLATVAEHLDSLEAKGAIRRAFNRRNAITLVTGASA